MTVLFSRVVHRRSYAVLGGVKPTSALKFTPQRDLCGLQPPSGPLEFTAEALEGHENLDRAHRQDDETGKGHADGRQKPPHECNRSESRSRETPAPVRACPPDQPAA
jgi:hypothetical protein